MLTALTAKPRRGKDRLMSAADVSDLLARTETEARREEFSLDTPPYHKANRDPNVPILFAGSLDSPVAFFARDLGWNEVLQGEPLIGDAGQRVRKALFRHLKQ